MPTVTHLVSLDLVLSRPDSLAPLCASWGASGDWSTSPALVTCPACLERLAAAGDVPAAANVGSEQESPRRGRGAEFL